MVRNEQKKKLNEEKERNKKKDVANHLGVCSK
jgi:hypothetical protein